MKQTINHIYIHYPFCTSRCGYCSFYTQNFSLAKQKDYLEILRQEIGLVNNLYDLLPQTIYLGGGSPSLLTPNQIEEIIQLLHGNKLTCEISLECNPITLTPKYIDNLAKTQINRLSLGIQSLDDRFLDYLGRKHKAKQVKTTLQNLRYSNFTNISGDLIYGLPKQKISDVERDIDKFIELELNHISIYCLSLDSDAPLYPDRSLIPEDELVADMYLLICTRLKEAGFTQYEISNFSKGRYQSQHNLAYWQQKDYLGLGAGAYGTIDKIRYNNSSFNEWEQSIRKEILFPEQEFLSRHDKLNEYIMLQLRLNQGLSLSKLKEIYAYDMVKEKKAILELFSSQNLIKQNDEKIYLTDKSRFISNYIISELMED